MKSIGDAACTDEARQSAENGAADGYHDFLISNFVYNISFWGDGLLRALLSTPDMILWTWKGRRDIGDPATVVMGSVMDLMFNDV